MDNARGKAALPELPVLSLVLRCTGAGEMDSCSQKACRSEVLASLSNAMHQIPLAALLYGLTIRPKHSGMEKLESQTSSLVVIGY